MSYRIFLNKLNQVASGIKKLLLESKDVALLQLEKPYKTSRSRRENELIRYNSESMKKIAVYLILQAPPIIGIIPTIVALKYPRHILTPHFWNDEEKKKFDDDEYKQKKNGSINLSNYLTKKKHDVNDIKSKILHIDNTVLDLFKAGGVLHIDKLGHKHINLLAHSHAILTLDSLISMMPPFLLKIWLKKRATDIIDDDKYLIESIENNNKNEVNNNNNANEVSNNELTHDEIITACIIRGIDPNVSESNMRKFLFNWIQLMKKYKKLYNENTDNLISLVIHSSALNVISTDSN